MEWPDARRAAKVQSCAVLGGVVLKGTIADGHIPGGATPAGSPDCRRRIVIGGILGKSGMANLYINIRAGKPEKHGAAISVYLIAVLVEKAVFQHQPAVAPIRTSFEIKPTAPGTRLVAQKPAAGKQEAMAVPGIVDKDAPTLVGQGLITFKSTRLEFQDFAEGRYGTNEEGAAKIKGKIFCEGAVLNKAVGVDAVKSAAVLLVRAGSGSVAGKSALFDGQFRIGTVQCPSVICAIVEEPAIFQSYAFIARSVKV